MLTYQILHTHSLHILYKQQQQKIKTAKLHNFFQASFSIVVKKYLSFYCSSKGTFLHEPKVSQQTSMSVPTKELATCIKACFLYFNVKN